MADFTKTITNRLGIFGGGEGSRFSGLRLGTSHWGTNHMLVTLITSGVLSQTVTDTLHFSSSITKILTKGITDVIHLDGVNSEVVRKTTIKGIVDAVTLASSQVKNPTKGIPDSIAFTTTIQASLVTHGVLTQTISNNLSFSGAPYKGVGKGIADSIALTTAPHFNVTKGIADTIALTTDVTQKISKYIADTIAFTTKVSTSYTKIAYIQNTISLSTIIGDFSMVKTISNNLHLTIEIGKIRDSILFYNSFGLSSQIARVYRVENGWIHELLKRPELWTEDTLATTTWS